MLLAKIISSFLYYYLDRSDWILLGLLRWLLLLVMMMMLLMLLLLMMWLLVGTG